MRNSTIKFRLILVLTLLTLITMALLATIETINYQNAFQSSMDEQASLLKRKLRTELTRKKDVSLAIAVALASDQRIHQALENQNRDLAMEVIKGLPNNFKQYTDLKSIKVQLHLPRAISFLRSWKPEKYGDDLSKARPDIVEVQNTLKPLPNIGVGKYAVSSRSVVPVLSPNGVLVGSIEVLQDLRSLYDALKQEQVSYVTVFTPEGAEVAKRNTAKTMLGQYKLANDNWFGEEAVQAARKFDINQLRQSGMLQKDDLMAMFMPIKVKDKVLAGHIIISNISKTKLAMKAFLNSLIITVALVLGVLLITIFVVMWSLQKWVFCPLKRLGGVAHEVAQQGDLSLRANLNQKDELGQFAQSFDSLLDTLNHIFGELRTMTRGLAAGNLEQQMNTDYQGDFQELAMDLNQSNQQIHRILNELSNVLDQFSKGEFTTQLPANGYQGVYLHLAETVNQTTNTLNSAILELNLAIQQLAKGEFDHQINAPLPGQLNELKEHTNQTLLALQDAIGEIVSVSDALAIGDLTQSIRKEYQGDLGKIKQGINQAIQGLHQAIGNVMESAQSVEQNAQQIEEAGSALNDRTQQQAAAIEETAASMEEMTSSVQSIAEHSRIANELAIKAQDNTKLGSSVMHSAEESMKTIRDQSHQIGEIIGLIDSIAFQTNLLALNAAVEAARAGDHGRGFAVVAGEVRNLAGKSSEASKNIRNLIAESVQQIEAGSTKFSESMQALQEIDHSISQLSEMVTEITAASNEQARGILQVNQTINAIDQTTQQNAAMVEETAAASEAMSDVAQSQLAQLKQFKLSTDSGNMDTSINLPVPEKMN